LIHLHLSGLPLNRQLKLLLKYYEKEPVAFYPLQKRDVIELFFRFQPLIPIFLYVNYIGQIHHQKVSKQKSLKTKSSKSMKSMKSLKKSKSTKSMKGGYLFMLTSRGEQPIRGVDMEEFLAKMDEAVQSVSYLPSAGPPEEGEQPNTYNAFALLYFLARNQHMNASFYAMPYIGDYVNIFSSGKGPRGSGTMKYSTLLRLWSSLQKEQAKADNRKTVNEEYSQNYENFVKEYMGRKEFRENQEDYKKYLDQLQTYKEKNDIEKKLFEAYEKKNPPKKDFVDKYGNIMSTLDQISMITSMIPMGK
jgi:hypothetical protein